MRFCVILVVLLEQRNPPGLMFVMMRFSMFHEPVRSWNMLYDEVGDGQLKCIRDAITSFIGAEQKLQR